MTDLSWQLWPYLQDAYADLECGCPVEEWIYRGITLTIHFEADGSLDVFADAGDWHRDFTLKAATMDEARIEAWIWVDNLPSEEELAA